MELVCPVGTPVACRDAVDAGADAVQCGFADETNAGHVLAPHFTRDEMIEAIAYAHAHGAKVIAAVDSFMRGGAEARWMTAVDTAVELGADAVLVSDIGLLAYAADKHPRQRRHLALQFQAATAPHIAFLVEAFCIRRAVLPPGLLVEEVLELSRQSPCEIEVTAGGVIHRRHDGPRSGPSLDMLGHLRQLAAAGVASIKVEDAPRGCAYVRGLVTEVRGADAPEDRAA